MSKITRMGSDQAQYAESISIPSDTSLVYVSGILADIADSSAPAGTIKAYGDTQTQTISILNKIKTILEKQNLKMNHVIQLRAFLVGTEEHEGRLDFKGFQKAYAEFFTDSDVQTKPTRTAIQVVGLPLPGTLVEIDVIAAKS
ncbi:RidA family protein [Acinetobacter baumannii]|nr:RidA family protein [Acinetobacter baumannii]MDO7463846.1 RidA family protein [Acinetobacter baumannii]